MEILPLYTQREKIEVKKKPVRITSCSFPLKRWSGNELNEIILNSKFVDIMKKLNYREIKTKEKGKEKVILKRNVPIPEGIIIDELILEKINDKYKILKKELSIKETPVKIKVSASKAKEISPHITESQMNNINIGICNMKGGEWKRTSKCCDLSKLIK